MRDIGFVSAPIASGVWNGQVIPSLQDADRETPHLGVYLLAGILEHHGFDIEIVDLVARSPFNVDEVVDNLCEYRILFFSCNSMNWAIVKLLASKVKKKNLSTKICVGGPHPTHYPQSVNMEPSIDFLFRGDGDGSIVKIANILLHGLEEECNGFGANVPGRIPPINIENDPGSVDFTPAYHRLPDGIYHTIPVETSRGCKFQCQFCSIPSKKNWRGAVIDKAAERIHLAEKYANKTRTGLISIVDDTFTTDHKRIFGLLENLDERFTRRLIYDATIVDLLNNNLVASLAPYTSDLLVGAEVATKVDAKKIKKAATPDLIRTAASNLNDCGISQRAVFSFIIGFPWHERADCIETVRFVKDLIVNFGVRSYIQWYWPMPGSEIWDGLRHQGLVNLSAVDEIGFFGKNEWFFPARRVTIDDVIEIDQKILLAQALLGAVFRSDRVRPIEYASPLEVARKVNRNPFMIAEATT